MNPLIDRARAEVEALTAKITSGHYGDGFEDSLEALANMLEVWRAELARLEALTTPQ